MKNKLLLAMLLLGIGNVASAQTKFLIKLRNKGDNGYSLSNPSAFLSARSIARRTRYNIPLDSTDLPVTKRYLDSIASVPNVTILCASKWLNQVAIQTSDPNALTRINNFPFVSSSAAISFRMNSQAVGYPGKFNQPAATNDGATSRVTNVLADVVDYGSSLNQIKIHNGTFLHNIGLRGEGMVIGMLDAGYQNYQTLSTLDSIRRNGQILGIYDFVANDGSVNEDDAHGVQCLSTIAANSPGIFVGTAFKANFYLFRTEDPATETPIEEHNWSCGAERIDSAGGDLISSSLGYYDFDAPFTSYNHSFSDLNGNITMAAIAADLAAKKGILVVNAAGNEGNNAWGRIITPADGDSVLAVGAVTYGGNPASFTSRGPSADGQVKPDVVSVGVQTIIQYPSGTIAGGNGTSFATPNLAGLVTCLWQGFPEFNNMKIIDALRRSATRYTNPNDTVGYGIPNVKKALAQLTTDYSTATATLANACKTSISWNSKDVSSMRYVLERNIPGQSGYSTLSLSPGQGSVFSNRGYQYIDTLINVPAGTVTYRIREIFDTSASGYIEAVIDQVTVNVGAGCGTTAVVTPMLPEGAIVVSPNPTRDNLAVRISLQAAVSDAQLVVTDAGGKVVQRLRKSLPSGSSTVSLSLGRYAGGKYFLSVYGNGRLMGTRELIKL